MRKRVSVMAVAALAVTGMTVLPMAANASTSTQAAASNGLSRQIATVSAKEVSSGVMAEPALITGTFWESTAGGSSIPAGAKICENGTKPGVYNWSSSCANHEDQVQNRTGYYARVHYTIDGYGAYACMRPQSYWLYLTTTTYDFSYPGEGYQPYGADYGLGQKIADNAASEALRSSCT